MPFQLNTRDGEFTQKFHQFLNHRREEDRAVDEAVHEIVKDVRLHGDDALFEYTSRFDGIDLRKNGVRLSEDRIEDALAQVPQKTLDALKFAKDRIAAYATMQMPKDNEYVDALGINLGWRWNAIESVGLYVPGGKAAYPSSVLMNAIPAKVAGVNRLAMVVPTPQGIIIPEVLAAASLAGINEVFCIGGAQAIAALAFGTSSIRPVDKIVGPGNAYVAAAKKLVFGHVGIDMIAGPSELLVIADETARPDWVAMDMLSQAEHDEMAQAILITPDASLAKAVVSQIEKELQSLERKEIAARSWEKHGAVVVTKDIEEAASIANQVAPEHLEIQTKWPREHSRLIKRAGAIFIGAYTPEAIGDYVAGPNHVLPTSRAARFSSGLSVLDFMTRTSLLECDKTNFSKVAEHATCLAECEGLQAHGLSIQRRNLFEG